MALKGSGVKGYLAPTVSVKGEGLLIVVGEGPSLPAAMDVNTPACREDKRGACSVHKLVPSYEIEDIYRHFSMQVTRRGDGR